MAKAKKADTTIIENSGTNSEMFEALDMLEEEKGIPKSYMLERIRAALEVAVKRDYKSLPENITVKVDEKNKEFRVSILKTVVEQVEDPTSQISVEEAKRISPLLEPGDLAEINVETKNFGRISAQTAKQVIIQGIREAERGMIFQMFTSKEHEIITATVSRVDPKSKNLTLEIGKAEAVLVASEQIPGEVYREGDRIRVYVVEAKNSSRGPQVMISRTHPGLVRRLFELEVPEIYDGLVEVKSISREAGFRSKLAVSSTDSNVDPVGACIGAKGVRVANIVKELGGEKIDIIKYSDDPAEYIAAALAPASVVRVSILDGEKTCRAIVPDDQLSLAIGKEGQNVRLAAKLTGWKIDIQPVSKSGIK